MDITTKLYPTTKSSLWHDPRDSEYTQMNTRPLLRKIEQKVINRLFITNAHATPIILIRVFLKILH